MSRVSTLVSVLVLAAAVLSGVPAWAHPAPTITADLPAAAVSPSTLGWSSAPSTPTLPWPVILAAAVALLAARRWPRRALALVIVLILASFAFENGVHSVHHLSDRGAGSTCPVATATAQLAGTPVDGAPAADLVTASSERVPPPPQQSVEASFLTAHQGRAPPIAA